MRLLDGETISKVNKELTNIKFSVSDLNLSNTKSNTTTYIKTQELSTLNLIKCLYVQYDLNLINFDKKNFELENCTNSNLNNVIKELYKRTIIPFYIPALILVSLLLIIKSKENINFTKQRILIFLIGLLFVIVSETTLRFVQAKLFYNLILIMIPIILVLFLYLFFYKSFKLNLN